MSPRPKQEYEERPSDDDGTPMERFKRLAAKVMAVPKDSLDERERERRGRQSS